jgi:hypothetical protein
MSRHGVQNIELSVANGTASSGSGATLELENAR